MIRHDEQPICAELYAMVDQATTGRMIGRMIGRMMTGCRCWSVLGEGGYLEWAVPSMPSRSSRSSRRGMRRSARVCSPVARGSKRVNSRVCSRISAGRQNVALGSVAVRWLSMDERARDGGLLGGFT